MTDKTPSGNVIGSGKIHVQVRSRPDNQPSAQSTVANAEARTKVGATKDENRSVCDILMEKDSKRQQAGEPAYDPSTYFGGKADFEKFAEAALLYKCQRYFAKAVEAEKALEKASKPQSAVPAGDSGYSSELDYTIQPTEEGIRTATQNLNQTISDYHAVDENINMGDIMGYSKSSASWYESLDPSVAKTLGDAGVDIYEGNYGAAALGVGSLVPAEKGLSLLGKALFKAAGPVEKGVITAAEKQAARKEAQAIERREAAAAKNCKPC